MDQRLLALLAAVSLSLVAIPVFGSDGPTDDHDEDGLPDLAEAILCSSEGIRETVVNPVSQAAGIGRCDSESDYGPSSDPSPDPPSGNDTDADGIPDAVEPHLCRVEFPSIPQDGSCDEDGEDYTLPDEVIPPGNPICEVEDPENETDGSCDDNGNYTAPGGVPLPDPNQAVCDVIRQNESLGSCDDQNNYTLPETGVDPMAVICGVVADHPELGNCENGNYTAPEPPGADPDEIMCGLENDGTDLDGECRNGQYIPPSPPGADDVVPAQLNCGRHDDLVNILESFLSDADCDGDNNLNELEQGCDPLDPSSTIDGGCEGSPVPTPPDGPPDQVHCSGYDPVQNPEELVLSILSDADCDGRNNMNDDAPLDPNQ